MVDKKKYPQVPNTVWWGLRSILNKTPNATIDERLLSIQLDVQEAAAKAYINELRQIGIITDDGKATELAQRWRLDDTYSEAVTELIEAVYPEGLVHIAPPGNAERQKVVSWFQKEGLGQGSAGNKAATYLLLSSPTPNEAPRAPSKSGQAESSQRAKPARRKDDGTRRDTEPNAKTKIDSKDERLSRNPDAMPLNVNVQIHISADAGTDQIESIFQAMRRYLYDAPTS